MNIGCNLVIFVKDPYLKNQPLQHSKHSKLKQPVKTRMMSSTGQSVARKKVTVKSENPRTIHQTINISRILIVERIHHYPSVSLPIIGLPSHHAQDLSLSSYQYWKIRLSSRKLQQISASRNYNHFRVYFYCKNPRLGPNTRIKYKK